MLKLQTIELKNERVLTTKQLAEVYETKENNIKNNFSNNKERFIEGKHYYKITGEELRSFKSEVNNFDLVPSNVNQLYLWTEKGASRMCKILDTNRAWDRFDELEETYFNVKYNKPSYSIEDPIERAKMWIKEQEEKQKLEIENKHNKEVIQGLTEDISISDKRSILNKVVRKGGKYKERYNMLYQTYKDTYHVDIKKRYNNYNSKNKDVKAAIKYKSMLDFADRQLDAIENLFNIACKLFESDIDKLVNELYGLR